MGMFNRLYVECPECKNEVEFQSKGGECMLEEYNLNCVPASIAEDLKNESEKCQNCGRVVTFKCKTSVNAWIE